MRILKCIVSVCLLLSALTLSAQTPAASQTAAAGTVKVTGAVKDSTGGVMQAVDVKIFRGTTPTPVAQGVTTELGVFSFDLPPGEYRVEVSAVDFKTENVTAQVAANMPPLSVTLTLAALKGTEVTVDSRTNELGVDPDSSLTSETLTGDDLLDLPDNEEDMLLYLQNLAARMGTGEPQILIDGFTEGLLPSRDQIQEIRIVNNSFSAEGDGGGPRIEIVTRSGTGRWGGTFNFQFADESLNAANAFTGTRAARQTRNYSTQAQGPIIRNKLTMGFELRSNESEGSAQSVRAITENGPVNDVLSSPTVQKVYGIRNARYSITPSNVFNFSGSITKSEGINQGVSGFNLRSRATNNERKQWQVQLSDRATLSNTMIHEARFQASRNNNQNIPVSDAMVINVADAFTGGGGSTRRDDHSTTYQLGDTLTWQLMRGKLNLRIGNEFIYRKNFSSSQTNYNGTYYFSSLHDYCWAINFNGTNCGTTQAIVLDAQANNTTPQFLNSRGSPITITGIPTRYTRTLGDPDIEVKQAEFSTFVQADWRLTPRAQLQTGLRYQVQQHLSDYNNFGPTLGLNYQVRNSPNWRSVVRVGGRISNQTFSLNNYQQLLQSDGVARQFNIDVLNPTFDPINGLPDSLATGGTSTSIRTRTEDYVTGYAINTSATWEQGLPGQRSVSLTFERTRGVHNNRNRNINAPFPGTRLPDEILALLNSNNPDLTIRDAERAEGRAYVDSLRPFYPNTGNITQMEPTGNSVNKRINLNFRSQNRNYLGGRVNLGGNVTYSYTWGYDDNNPVNVYDIASHWGLSNRQHRVQGQAQLNLYQNAKWKNLRLTLQPTWNSGSPYSITLGRDENGDSSTNDRPLGVARNTETGPSRFNMNLNVSKTFFIGIGGGTPRPSNYAEPQGGGGFGGGGGGGGFGGVGGRGGNPRNQRGTQMTISASIQNVLNNTQLGNYSGVLTSAFFGRANTSTNERRVTLNLQIRYQ
jgi:hypothetical protein